MVDKLTARNWQWDEGNSNLELVAPHDIMSFLKIDDSSTANNDGLFVQRLESLDKHQLKLYHKVVHYRENMCILAGGGRGKSYVS